MATYQNEAGLAYPLTKMNFLTRGRGFFAIAPDIKAASNIKDNISVYGSITGGRTNNGFARLEEITPYWGFVEGNSARLKPTYRIVDINLGSRISFEPLSMEFNAGYAYTKDELLEAFPSTATSSFSLMYAEFGQELQGGVRHLLPVDFLIEEVAPTPHRLRH